MIALGAGGGVCSFRGGYAYPESGGGPVNLITTVVTRKNRSCWAPSKHSRRAQSRHERGFCDHPGGMLEHPIHP